jgi:anti-sigma regulatory factor (Ser/Thr protein kinase)
MAKRRSAESVAEPQRIALLADDHHQNLKPLQDLVLDAGWQCRVLAAPSDLESTLQEGDVSIVFLPEECFGFSAEQLCSQIKDLEPDQIVYVVGDHESPEEGRYEVLPTPLSPEKLREVLSSSEQPGSLVTSPSALRHSERISLSTEEVVSRSYTPEIFSLLKKMYPRNDSTLLQIELAYQEALANSFEHGNLGLQSEWRDQFGDDGVDKFSQMKAARLKLTEYTERSLQVWFSLADSILTIEIHDEGSGFDHEKVLKQKREEGLQCHGRGMKIMNLVMDTVEYFDHGRGVRLTKKLHS